MAVWAARLKVFRFGVKRRKSACRVSEVRPHAVAHAQHEVLGHAGTTLLGWALAEHTGEASRSRGMLGEASSDEVHDLCVSQSCRCALRLTSVEILAHPPDLFSVRHARLGFGVEGLGSMASGLRFRVLDLGSQGFRARLFRPSTLNRVG